MRIAVFLLLLLAGFTARAAEDFGTFREWIQQNNALVVQTTKGAFYFRVYPNEMLQTTWEPNGYAGEQVSDAVMASAQAPPRLVQQNAGSLRLQVGKLHVTIQKNPVQLLFSHSGRGITLARFGQTEQHRYLQFAIAPQEPFFGAGSRSVPLNRSGYRLELNNNPWYGYNMGADNLNYSLPLIQSARGYALFFDNPSRGYLDLGKTQADVLEAGFVAGKLQFYTFFGSSPAVLNQRFTSLVGRMPLPPRWALGNLMSRFGYKTQNEVLEIAGMMEAQRFPFDAVIIDLFWFGDGVHGAWNMGNLDWDRKRFPEPEQMIQKLGERNVKTILITEPFVLAESFNYQATQQQGLHAVNQQGDTVGIAEFYFGHAGLLDLFKKQSRDWFWRKYDAQIQKGVAGWWGDLGEPEKHPDYLYHNLSEEGHSRLFQAGEVHNLYGHRWSRMLYEKYAQHYPAQRLFHLNRSGYAGTWRYGSFPWSGDVDRSWKGLQAQLPLMLGTALSGIPTMHSDAGGFAMGKRDPELYRRWLQMAVFSPILRPHGSVSAPEAGSPSIESEPVFYDEPDKSILRSFVELRYRLMPYIYNMAWESTTNGTPFMRPMFYNDTTDPELYAAADQYYFGPSLLVAPVLEAGATRRRVYLPRGEWYDFWKPGMPLKGQRWIEVPVDAATIPVFVKAGSVLPMKPVHNNSGGYPLNQVELHYYAGGGTQTTTWYEDDGMRADALAANAYELITVTTNRTRRGAEIRIRSNGGSFAGMPDRRQVLLQLYGLPATRKVVVKDVPKTTWHTQNGVVTVQVFDWQQAPLHIGTR